MLEQILIYVLRQLEPLLQVIIRLTIDSEPLLPLPLRRFQGLIYVLLLTFTVFRRLELGLLRLVFLFECRLLLLAVVDEVTLIGVLGGAALVLIVIVDSDLRIVVGVVLGVVATEAALLLVGLRLDFRLREAVDTRLILGGRPLLEVLIGPLLGVRSWVKGEVGGVQAYVHLAF